MSSGEPFEALTLKTSELAHLMDKAETTRRRAIAERVADWDEENFADDPVATEQIGGSIERIEVALDDLFLMRAAYVFDGRRDEVSVPVSDLVDLLMETDFN
ncbi:hypothetical protein CLV79_10227 [Limimaricola soesokkakensis]|uniref:Uncharacterized protein n=1 Tax=Limimaricola soesokkakensis TaxID=1343159 RepID=A0A1X6YTF4_9RHOB|nr:hypothetical protein [Limimaricola soesokkakensis]PSK87548.1 hypothetical protein CLV79_10227 [Limimaricola soesokkakensis]SLN30971.1 hypothetical protein LOS8367_01111 [Limimaricola soesokkakensis]